MSEIICSKCHQANPGSSKFCNHCGNTLPPPDSIICPNCNASNPKKTYYCDECGTRLIADKLDSGILPSDEPVVDESSEFFSLPVRKVGDVAEFDPADLSSWLEDETDDNLSSLVQETGDLGTGGLPDWLINESNPILDVPSEITTAHFNLLVDTDENLPELPPRLDANLPDWLVDVADDSTEATAADDASTGTAVPDWMPTPDVAQDSSKISGQTVADLSPSESESEFDFEELFDFDDSGTIPVGKATPADSLVKGDSFYDDEDDDWLNVLTEDGEDLLTEERAVSSFDSAIDDPIDADLDADFDDLPDWLAEDTVAVAAEVDDNEGDEDWLDALIDDGDDLFVEETAVSSEPSVDLTDTIAAATIAIDAGTDDGSDWLSDLGEGGIELFEPSAQSEDDVSSLDWLDDATASGGDFDEELDDLFAGTELIDDAGLDWLATEDEAPSDSLPVDDLVVAGTTVAAAETVDDLWQDNADNGDLEDEPDWLTEYATDPLTPVEDEDLIIGEELVESDEPFDDLFAESPAADSPDLADEFSLETTALDISFAAQMLGDDGDWVGDSTADVGADLPDWLDDLGETGENDDDAEIDGKTAVAAAIVNEVPDWLADMAPGTVESNSGLSLAETASGLADEDDFDSLTFDDDEELSDTGLPEWLREDATEDGDMLVSAVMVGLATVGTVAADGDIIDDLLDGDDDFSGIDLSDLSPIIPIEDRLSKANIPDWIEELKPDELTPEGAAPEAEPVPESAGPLVGIGGVIALQSAVTPSYDSILVNQFEVTKEHQQQAALLRQLTQGERKLSSGMTQSDAKTSARVRMALIVALLLVAMAGLFGPSLVTLPTEPSPALVALHDELTAVSNQPVLIAFEYTPAMAGELNAEAETLLATLAENGSPVVAVSQSAAGSTIAATYLPEDGMQIGMVTGGAAGLRQLADCVGGADGCTTLLGREVAPDEQELLGDVALIIVLTGERDSMLNWIEQVGTTTGLPVVAGLTASIAPLAAPYYDSGQIAGMMVGLTDTAVYQQEWQTEVDDSTLSRLNAHALLQLTAALLLIAGGIYYGVIKAKKQNEKVDK